MSEVDELSTPEVEKPYSYDAVIVLGAFMQRDKKTGEWRLPTIIEEDPGKVVGGHSRAIAVQQLYTEHASPLFIITGGVQKDEEGNPSASRAQTLANVITDKYKVPTESLAVVTTVGNTLGNIDDTVKFLQEHKDLLKEKKIAVLSNEWHLERALLMFGENEYFRNSGVELLPIAVEDILQRRSKHYEKWADQLNNSDAMKTRKKMEEKGIKDFKSGKYKPLSS